MKLLECPVCHVTILLEKVNCGVLRCGTYRLKNGKVRQLPRHATKEKIERLEIVQGCGSALKYCSHTQTLVME